MQVPERSLFVTITTKPTEYTNFDLFVDEEAIDVDVTYDETISIIASVSDDNISVVANVIDEIVDLKCDVFNKNEIEYYNGRYIVIPTDEDQELETKKKAMRENVLVKEVPTYTVANEKGYSFIILN